MSRRRTPAHLVASTSSPRTPPSSLPPPPPPSLSVPRSPSSSPPPPPPENPSAEFTNGADFIRFGSVSEHDSEPDRRRHSSSTAGKQKDSGNPRKRKSSALEEESGPSRNVRPRWQPTPTRSTPWMRYVNWEGCMDSAEMLHREMEAFCHYISPTDEEHSLRAMIIQTIENALVTAFPDAQLLPFGSFETKLYLPTGDIDLVLRSQEIFKHDKKRVLYSIATLMKRAGIATNVTVVASAKVPIVKFVTRVGNLSVDISINQENGIVAGALINKYLEGFPAARPLAFLIKSFLSQRGLNEVFSGGLGSYSTILLVISFLQMHPKIRQAEIDPSRNLGVLITELFELYGKYFNYDEVGISLHEGGTYFNKHNRGWDINRSCALSVEDPCDPSNDVSRGSFAMSRVRASFHGACGSLNVALFKKAQNINDLQEKYERRGRRADHEFSEPDYSSMLGSIVGITEETILHRQHLNTIWDTGTLHRLLGLPPPVKLRERDAHSPPPLHTPASAIMSPKTNGHPLPARPPKADEYPLPARPPNQALNGDFSVARELDLDFSDAGEDGEVQRPPSRNTDSDDGVDTSKYGIRRKRTPTAPRILSRIKDVVYEEDYSGEDDDGLVVTPVEKLISKKVSNGPVKIQRNREYWNSKAVGRSESRFE